MSPDELKERSGTSNGEKESLLPGVDMSPVPEEWSRALRAILKKHAPLWGGILGLIRCVDHRILLKSGAVPVGQNPDKAAPLARKIEKKTFERMRLMGVIEPSIGEWASPVVLVPKPDGSVRFCVYKRKLDLITVKDAYASPRMNECIHSLGHARVFSTLDYNARHWQIPVAEDDKHPTEFRFHLGAW